MSTNNQLSLPFEVIEWEYGYIPTYGGKPILARRSLDGRFHEIMAGGAYCDCHKNLLTGFIRTTLKERAWYE